MLIVSNQELQSILEGYNIFSTILSVEELLRCDCDVTEQDRNEIKLILKINLSSCAPIVVKFRGGNSDRNHRFVIESQAAFANILYNNGIPTPQYYKSFDSFSTEYNINGYNTVVTVEDYCENEI